MFGLEEYVHDILSRSLGQFVAVPRDGISFSIWEGEGALDGVSVRPDALASLALRVVAGRVRRIRLIVPWHALRSVPVMIKIEGLELRVQRSDDSPQPADAGERANATAAAANEAMQGAEFSSSSGGDCGGGTACGAAAGGGGSTGGGSTGGGGTLSRYFERIAALVLSNIAIEVDGALLALETRLPSPPLGGAPGGCAHLAAGGSGAGTLSLHVLRASSHPADAHWRRAKHTHTGRTRTRTHARTHARARVRIVIFMKRAAVPVAPRTRF